MSSIQDRLANLYARASTETLCVALEEIATRDGIEYRQVRTWLISELERRSPKAEAAGEELVAGDNYPSHATYARTIAQAARADAGAA